jgi:hypothetical protein
VLRYERGTIALEDLPFRVDISAVAIDHAGNTWVAGAGHMAWREAQGTASRWKTVWTDPTMSAPIVSLHANVGQVVAMMADGCVLQGTAQ